ncbi:thiamine ABC transporter ATP-binding protein ThiQ [Klebsiella variicola subsp. variicola]|nr:thiamine ABC transporter ATP-binding protein ThiQ [Klebsiella variicola subsp. variicola]
MLKLNDVTWLYQASADALYPRRRARRAHRGARPQRRRKEHPAESDRRFLPPASGSLRINGEVHNATPPAQRPVSMLFQENNLFNHLTVRQNISLGIHPGLKLSREQQAQVAAMAGQMGIDALLERLPGELSGGQRQRAALARCLVRQQPVLLLDEPFSALDPALRQEMLSLVADVCEQQQLTLLMVSHSVEDAARIAPRSIVVAEGRIVWDGATAELLSGNSSASHLMGISAQ